MRNRIASWKFFVTETGSLYLQVWRQLGGTYRIVGENEIIVSPGAPSECKRDQIENVFRSFFLCFKLELLFYSSFSGPLQCSPPMEESPCRAETIWDGNTRLCSQLCTLYKSVLSLIFRNR